MRRRKARKSSPLPPAFQHLFVHVAGVGERLVGIGRIAKTHDLHRSERFGEREPGMVRRDDDEAIAIGDGRDERLNELAGLILRVTRVVVRHHQDGGANVPRAYSHSIVAGGFDEISYVTRFTPLT